MNSLLPRLLLVVVVALVPALGFQAYMEIAARQVRQQLMQEEALRLVRFVNAEQQRIVDGADEVLNVVSSMPAVQDPNPDLCQRVVRNVLARSPRYDNIIVIDLDGHPTCAAAPVDRSADLSSRGYFRLAMQTGGFVIGDYVSARQSGKPTIHLAKPFSNQDGVVHGIVAISLNLEWLGQELARTPLPAAASAVIADRNGTILARYPDTERYRGRSILTQASLRSGGGDIHVTPMIGLDGRARLAAFSPLSSDPTALFVGVGLDQEAAFASVTAENRIGVTLIAGGVLLALALTALVGSRLIRRPVTQLLEIADRWRMGDLTARTGLRGTGSEFRRLAAAFDDMAGALEAREHALCNALESTTDTVIALDRDWRYTYLNNRARVRLAQDRELLGQVIWKVFPELSDSVFGEAYRQAMQSGVPVHVEAFYASLDGHWEVHAYPSADGLTVFARDVTEERRTTIALRDSEERLRIALEAARMGIWERNLDQEIPRWTSDAARILGLGPAGETDFEHWLAAVHPDDRARAVICWDAALANAETDYEAEYRVRQPDGTWRWIAAYGRVLHEAGQAPRAIGVVQDISARKQILEALQASETRLQLARDAAGLGVWDQDYIAGTRIWSEDQWRLYGLQPQPGALSVAEWAACIHPDDRERQLVDRTDAVAGNADRIDQQFRVIWPDGSFHWLLTKAMVLRNPYGEVLRIVGVTLDVTATRQTETELRRLGTELEERVRKEVAAREEAQLRAAHAERMQALGQLAGGIAHDFNNVLQAVAGAITLIDRRPGDQAGLHRLTRMATEATERGASITRRLLAFGRRGDLRAEAIDPAMLLQDVREILAHTLNANIDVRVELNTDLRPFQADKGQLETTLINLATNARDAMPNGGKLTYSAGMETISAGASADPNGLDPGRYLRLIIQDTGFGMDAATLARASEPFFTTKKIGAGTGLGLAMAKAFTEQSGGGLKVESVPGESTTITLWLPETDAVPTPADAAPIDPAYTGVSPQSRPGGNSRVLLIDDESSVRQVLAMNLEDMGFAVLPVASGTEALALLAAGERVDAMVTDLSMPGMDGLAVIRAVQERYRKLPAVLLTGYASDGAALAMGGAINGTFSLLRKPASSGQLCDRLHAMLAGADRCDGGQDAASARAESDGVAC